MKRALFLAGVVALLTNAGCLVTEEGRHGGYHGYARHESHAEVVVGPPVVVVRPAEVIVR